MDKQTTVIKIMSLFSLTIYNTRRMLPTYFKGASWTGFCKTYVQRSKDCLKISHSSRKAKNFSITVSIPVR